MNQEITTTDLDLKFQQIREVRAKKKEAEQVVKGFSKEKTDFENQMISMLKQVGKKKWEMLTPEGKTAVFSIAETFTVTTPKTIEEKAALWDYLEGKYGAELAMEKFSINANTLNAFYNQEYESIPDSEKAMWNLPGVGTPTMYEEPHVRES